MQRFIQFFHRIVGLLAMVAVMWLLALLVGCDSAPIEYEGYESPVVRIDTLYHPCFDVMYKYRCMYTVVRTDD